MCILRFLGFHLYDLYSITDQVYGFVLIGTLSYIFGTIIRQLFSKIKIRIFEKNNNSGFDIASLRHVEFIDLKKTAYGILIVALIIESLKIALMLPIILQNGMAYARYLMQVDQNVNLSGSLDILLLYFAKPYIRAYIIVYTVNSIKKGIKLTNILQVIVLALTIFLTDGGRTTIFNIIIMLVFLLIRYRHKLSSRYKNRIVITSFIFFMLFIMVTQQRNVNIFAQLYTYYCGSLSYLSQALGSNYLFDEVTYGYASLQGILNPIFGLFGIIGIKDPHILQYANEFTMNAQSFTVYISRSEFMNYYMTCFGYAFKDGGYIALILLLTALGYFYSSIDKKQLKNDIITDSVKIWGYQTLLFTMSIYPLASYNNVMTLVYVFIITSEMLTIERCVD